MTEAAFQAARKIMASANYKRGQITKAMGNVAKWTRIEDVHRREGRISQADGAKKCLERAIAKLADERKKFADMKFPDNDLQEPKVESAQCIECGSRVAKGNDYCGECLCEDDGYL